MRPCSSIAALCVLLLLPISAAAQASGPEATVEGSDDEARAVFQAGNVAFNDARYEDALGYFQRAYELSGRPELLYNIGVASDRLRRDAITIEAFEGFLRDVAEHPRRRDAAARLEVLRAARASGSSPAAAPGSSPPSSGPDALTLGGSITLMALGVAGVVTGVIGLAGAGECLAMDGATCVEERQPGWLGIGIWGGLGVAALTAGIVWLAVGLSGGGAEEASALLGPNGELSWQL